MTSIQPITAARSQLMGFVPLTRFNVPGDEPSRNDLDWSDPTKPVTDAEQRTVLVVDDDQAIREALADVLGELGYEVAVASDGEQALACLRAGCDPFVILLDLGMPVMDGWEFRRQLLGDPSLADLRVVVITAARDQRVDTLQVTDVLTKPVQLERLVQILESTGASS